MGIVDLDLYLAGAAIALGLAFPRLGAGIVRRLEPIFDALAGLPPLRACAGVAALVLIIRLALLPVIPIPEPAIHDEFSMLLAADTYAHGRLTNPTHAHWQHFETMHVNHLPTYMSMYPLANGLVMAAGKVVAGHPWYGILAAASLMCGVITWTLQGWLPPGWALVGGLLFALRVGLFSYWMNSYYAAAITTVGAALVIGALPRLLRNARAYASAAALGAGIVILANTRPYEGFLLTATVGLILLAHLVRDHQWRIAFFGRAALLLAVILGAGAAGTGYHNWRVYGSPLTLAYTTHRAMYAPAPVFSWQKPKPIPVYRHQAMHDFYAVYEMREHARSSGRYGLLLNILIYSLRFWQYFLYPALSIAFLLGLRWLVRDRSMRLAWILFLVPIVSAPFVAFFMAHYVSPAIPAFYVLLTQSLRHAHDRIWPSRKAGAAMVRNLVASIVLLTVFVAPRVSSQFWLGANWHFVFPPIPGRAKVIEQLRESPGRDLVLVSYRPSHDSFIEWVYNEADIDGAEIVWARAMNPEADDALVNYFRHQQRRVWLLDADGKSPQLQERP